MRVEPDDTDLSSEPCDRPERAVAVAGHDEGEAAGGDRLPDAVGKLADDDHRRGDLVHEVGLVLDRHAAAAQCLDQDRNALSQADVLAAEVVRGRDQRDLAHPRSVDSLSTSSSSRRRCTATIRPRPTTTSEAATAITASANTCPSNSPWWRENVISARFAPLSMISSERRTISGLRRSITPSAPIANRNAATARYHVRSGPITGAAGPPPREADPPAARTLRHARGCRGRPRPRLPREARSR